MQEVRVAMNWLTLKPRKFGISGSTYIGLGGPMVWVRRYFNHFNHTSAFLFRCHPW